MAASLKASERVGWAVDKVRTTILTSLKRDAGFTMTCTRNIL